MTRFLSNLKCLLLVLVFFSVSKKGVQAQCIEIESILVAACGQPEGYNEMFRFRVGALYINTNNLTVNWPSQSWGGLVQNAGTAAKVATLNANIISAGGCAQLLEPLNGVLPANAPVIIVTSYLFDTDANSFGPLNENTYILFQNSTTSGGHFGNYQPTGTRTLSISFGGGCNDSVTYTRNLLSQDPGAAVNYTPAGAATYYNSGCTAPVAPFTVDAGPAARNTCAGKTLNFTGTTQGSQSVEWTATDGTFSNPTSLTTTFTVPPTASGIITVTLTAFNTCGTVVTDTVLVTVNPSFAPQFNIENELCSGQLAPILPTTSINGVAGTWSPSAVSNTTSGAYIFTPSSNSCATTFTLDVTVGAGTIEPTFDAISPICSGETLASLPTISNNGITGTWSPALNNSTTTEYTFTPTAGQCATTVTLIITVNASVIPTFTPINSICEGEILSELPTTSNNGISGTWSPPLNNTATTTYTFTPNTTILCETTATLIITVNPVITPTFANVSAICEGENLTPLPLTSQNGIAGSWSPEINNTTTTTYTFTPNAGQCAITTTLTIVVNNAENVSPITGNNSVCIGNTLPLANATPGGIWTSNNPNVASVDNNGLVTPLTPGFATISYTTSACAIASIDITVYLPPNPLLTDRYICVDKITGEYISTVNMQCGVENADHTFEWTLNGQPLSTNTNLHVATEEGLYEVTVTNNTTGCTSTAAANVIKSSIAISEATVTEDFQNNQIITITVTGGSGDYEYQLDNNWPQASNQFVVQQGEYTITVIDKNGCGSEVLTVFALNYPRYFTPNNDGYNDTWSIAGLKNQRDAQIFIFDRYGKLVKALKPYLSESWDGTLNGNPLPSTDYWFTLKYMTKEGLQKELRSHFSLKR